MAPVLQARGEALEQADRHLSKARLKRVSSRPVWGLLIRGWSPIRHIGGCVWSASPGFEPCVAYDAVQEGLTLTPKQCGVRSGAGRRATRA